MVFDEEGLCAMVIDQKGLGAVLFEQRRLENMVFEQRKQHTSPETAHTNSTSCLVAYLIQADEMLGG